jgi:hypothetical protein
MESSFQLTRKLQVTRAHTNDDSSTYQYNQMLNLSVSNQLGVECWNSYSMSYSNNVAIYAADHLKNIILTNDEGFSANLTVPLISTFLPINNWQGYAQSILQPNPSFKIPLNASLIIITDSTYVFNMIGGIPHPYLTNPPASSFETNVDTVNAGQYSVPQPHWWLITTNDLRVIMLDTTIVPNRIIDYVQLGGPNGVRDLTQEILTNFDSTYYNGPGFNGFNDLWDTNLSSSGLPYGILNQLEVSKGTYGITNSNGAWNNANGTAPDEISGFRAFYHLGQIYFDAGAYQSIAKANSTNATQAPFTPTATVVQHVSWQANDPLVHYLAADLNWSDANRFDVNVDSLTNENLGALNYRYMPWGGYPLAGTPTGNAYNTAIKDPLVSVSDNWDFPTYKFPTVGWLGRVHRGTPWQTVYLKSSPIDINTWANWTGDFLASGYDAGNSAPTNDWLLFALFTTAFNDNATRGTLSVNVGPTNANLAAWSALFSGIVVPTNLSSAYPPLVIQPAGPDINSPLWRLVYGINGINQTRANTNLFPSQSFAHVGDILSVPQFTEQSPFLALAGLDPNTQISDEMYEWLPQQTMSLLRCSSSPRYVIYCYGQALKPAPDSIVTSGGPYFGMITNYQVVSEIATRAIVRFNSTLTNVITTDGTNWFSVPVVTNNNAVIESFNILPPD